MEIVKPEDEIKSVVGDLEKEEARQYKADNRRDIDTHKKILALYKSVPQIREYIKGTMGYFTPARGVRSIAVQRRFPDVVNPLVWYPKGSNLMLNKDSLTIVLENNIGQIHFFEVIYDKDILNEELINKEINEVKSNHKDIYEKMGITPIRAMVYNKHIIGDSYVFDIDAPDNCDIFDIWEEFMFIKMKIEWYLDGMGLKYRCIFSGNGIYVVVEECYFKTEDYVEFVKELQKLTFHINHYVDQYYKYKIHPRIDDKGKSWWNYVKTIFTYDTKTNRITIPINKGYVDLEFMKKVTDIDKFIGNKDVYLKEVMIRQEWRVNKV